MDYLWIGFMSAAVVLQAAGNALPHYAPAINAASAAAFQLACLFANPAAALAALKNMSPRSAPPAAPAAAG